MQQKRLNYQQNKPLIIGALNSLISLSPSKSVDLERLLRKFPSKEGEIFSKSFLLTSFMKLKETSEFSVSPEEEEKIISILQMKKVRTISGVTPVTVLTKPFPCPGKCIFCPSDTRMPKSYLSWEPGAQRALSNKFDPYLQTFNRLKAFKNTSHPTDKIELIILGGTWSSYPLGYQIWFVKRCFDAMNDFENDDSGEKLDLPEVSMPFDETKIQQIDGSNLETTYNKIVSRAIFDSQNLLKENSSWEELTDSQIQNVSSKTKCVGLVIETRPDEITENELIKIRRLGATKIQLGVQSIDDYVLGLNKRGHGISEVRNAFDLIRRAGFKIHAHIMPNLYGSNLEKDKENFLKLFQEEYYRPDELKIYPCSLISSAELMSYYQKGLWKPYSQEELLDVLRHHITHTPRYCRLTRIIRDIPSTDIVTGNKLTNFRQIVENSLQGQGSQIVEIRSREVQDRAASKNKQLKITTYDCLNSKEFFIEYVGDKDQIFGFLRLSLPKIKAFISEIDGCALIREVHVYGKSVAIGKRDQAAAQHSGLGKNLINEAEKIALENRFLKIAVISAIGTREYYQRFGYKLNSLYQLKELS